MIVVDASAVLDVLLNTPSAPKLQHRLFLSGEDLHAPHHIDLEIVQALRRFVRSGQLSADEATVAIDDWRDVPISLHSPRRLMERIWDYRDRMSAYDAAYVVLAELLDATLVTTDNRLARAAVGFVRVAPHAP